MNLIQKNTFRHEPLAPGRNIRILALQPSRDFISEIQCVVIEASLDEARGKYEALSYVWGSKTCDYEIKCNDEPHHVTQNCLLALLYLRKKRKMRFLWVDAICIDQLSNDERGHQVELMGEVYKNASSVIIWLGVAQPETKKAFRHAHNCYRVQQAIKKAKTLKNLVEKAKIFTDPECRKYSSEFLRLFSHAWFDRVWTFQELLMASRATVHCGHHCLPWEELIERIQPFSPSEEPRETKILLNVVCRRNSWAFWQREFTETNGDSHATANAETPDRNTSLLNPIFAGRRRWLFTIYSFGEVTRERHTSEPLDRLFGLYGLFRHMGFNLPKPDYHKTGLQVAQEMTTSILEVSRSLSLLYFFAVPCLGSGGPSWVLDWEDYNGDFSARDWGVEDGSHLTFRQDFTPVFDEGSLGLEGILYGTMHPFGNPVPGLDLLDYGERFDIVKWLQETLSVTKLYEDLSNGQPAWEAFFIAYFKGYYPYFPPEGSHGQIERMTRILLQFGMARTQLPRHTDSIEHRLGPNQLHTLNDDELYAYIRSHASVQEFTETLVKTARECPGGIPFRTSQGWIGLSMGPIEPSDLLALLHGSSVPAILRPVGEHYRLVSFASVKGIPNHAWPINGDEQGTQRIVLI